METWLEDVRLAVRVLSRQPLLTAVVVATLGFGIGANTAVFGFVEALLLRPYAFPELDALVTLSERHPQQGGQASVRPSDPGHPIAVADFLDLQAQCRGFEALAAFRAADVTLSQPAGPERLAAVRVSPELFGLLRVRAALGRTLRPEEAEPGRDSVVVVSHGFWQRRLGGAPDVLGRALLLNGMPHALVGVMPPDFDYPPGGTELWAPLAFSAPERTERGALSLRVIGRLADGVSLEQARADLREVALRLERAHPRSNAGRSFGAVRLREQQAGLTGPFAALFQGAALFVLAIVCTNVGWLLLARGLLRQREMAVRAALGASRWRVARQSLVESLTLSALGGLLALGVAAAGVRLIRGSVPSDITRWVAGWSQIRLDASALGFALAAALVTALATGLAPALGAARVVPLAVFSEGGRGVAGVRGRWRSLLVVSQIALALVLLVGASLLVGGFGRILGRYERLEPAGLLSFRVRLPDARYPPGRSVSDFYERLLLELARIPGVLSVGAAAHLPGDLGPVPGGAVSVRGRTARGDLDLPVADQQAIGPGYFRTLGLRVIEGRGPAEADAAGAPPVAVVSQAMARRLWPPGQALGQQVKPGAPDGPGPWRLVVGVVEDVTQYWFDREPRSTLYLPQAQAPRAAMFVVVRASGDAAALGPTLRARVAALDPELPIDELRTLRQVVDDGMAFLRLARDLLLLLGAVALGLAALGVYAVIAQDVAQRTREIGVRLALGARPAQVRWLVLARAVRLATAALALGVPGAAALARSMSGALFGVAAPDPRGIAALALAVLALAPLAAWRPAARAAALDPAAALRTD